MASMDMRADRNASGMLEFELACTMLFTMEAAIKIIDSGFWFAQDTYFRSGWNQFDFLLVVGNLVSYLEIPLGDKLLALRTFRCFRPLRAMRNFRDGQLLVRTVIKSLPLMRDALVFLGWFILVAGVTGTMLFGGKLTGRCTAGVMAPPPPPFPGGLNAENGSLSFAPGDYLSCPPLANVSAAGAICDPAGKARSLLGP